MFLEYWVFSTK